MKCDVKCGQTHRHADSFGWIGKFIAGQNPIRWPVNFPVAAEPTGEGDGRNTRRRVCSLEIRHPRTPAIDNAAEKWQSFCHADHP
jgi:hypothetical protein